jgi:ankyrin repeat protein
MPMKKNTVLLLMLVLMASLTSCVHPRAPFYALGSRITRARMELKYRRAAAINDAIQKSDLAKVSLMVKRNPGLAMEVDVNGSYPLHHAAQLNEIAVTKVLVGAGADINVRNGAGETPLHIAVARGHGKLVETLEGQGAKLDVMGVTGNSPFLIAIQTNHLEIAEFLASRGADVKVRNGFGQTALHVAASRGNLKSVNFLIDRGLDVNEKDSSGNGPLWYALVNGRAELLKVLSSRGGRINERDSTGGSMLHLAARRGDVFAIGALLEAGADVNFLDSKGYTPLNYALEYSSLSFTARSREGALILRNKGGTVKDIRGTIIRVESHGGIGRIQIEIDRGEKDGVLKGDIVEIMGGGHGVGRAQVTQPFGPTADARVLDSNDEVRKGMAILIRKLSLKKVRNSME